MTEKRELIQSILSEGKPLQDLGVNNWALSKSQCLQALEVFRKSNIIVLGGDVYAEKNGELELNYENWFCEREKNESLGIFSQRSINQSINYIKNYDCNSAVYFALIISDD